MSRSSGKSKVPKMTEEQYAEYVMSLKDEAPLPGYREEASGNHATPHTGVRPQKKK